MNKKTMIEVEQLLRRHRRRNVLLSFIGGTFTFLGFGTIVWASTDSLVEKTIEANVRAIIEKHGFPSIVNGRDYLTAKQIYEDRDKAALGTFTYIADNNGRMHCVGLSLGYPLPASVQIANPERYLTYGVTIPQAEANALFMPEGLQATYHRMINPVTGEAKLGFFEDQLNVVPEELPNAATPCDAFKPNAG